MDFEDILNQVGGFGKFQKNLAIFFFLPLSVAIPFFWMSLLFMVSVPDHWCHVPELSTLSPETRRLVVSSADNPTCEMRDLNYTVFLSENSWNYSFNDSEVKHCLNGWEYDRTNYDSTAGTAFNMVCDQRHYPSLVLTLQKMGILIGLPIYGHLSDKFGRKRILMLILLIIAITEVTSVFVNSFILFCILKIINSTGLSTIVTLACILSFEFVMPHKRTFMSGVINLGWTFGICLLPLVVYLSKSWVILGLVDGLLAAVFLLFWNYIPESPCWLISQGRCEEAMLIISKIGEKNDKKPDSVLLLKQLQDLGERIKRKKDDGCKSFSIFNILKYPRIRKTFFILAFCQTANYVGYIGLIYNVNNLNGNEFLNFFLLSIIELPGTVILLALMDRIGRRWLTSFGYLVTAFFCFLPIFNFPYSDILSSMIGKFITAGIFMVTDQQSSELIPTVIRSFAIGSVKTIANAITVALPFISNLSDYGRAVPFIVIGVTCLAAAVCSSFLTETLDENLPHTIADAEEFGKDHKYFSWNRKKVVSEQDNDNYDLKTQSDP